MMKSGKIKEIFQNWREIKIIWKETKVLKFIWKLTFWKLNLRIWILGIKFERNWNFKNHLRIGVSEIKFERNQDFENWNFEY